MVHTFVIIGRKLCLDIMLVLSFQCGFLGSVLGEVMSKKMGK